MSERVASLEDEKRRKQELASFCRHASAILEMMQFALEQLNPASRAQAFAHVRSEATRLFFP